MRNERLIGLSSTPMIAAAHDLFFATGCKDSPTTAQRHRIRQQACIAEPLKNYVERCDQRQRHSDNSHALRLRHQHRYPPKA